MKVYAALAMLTPKSPVLQSGVTFEQAMEAHRLFNEELIAVPSVAHMMGIDYEIMCKLLYGTIWRAAKDRWD